MHLLASEDSTNDMGAREIQQTPGEHIFMSHAPSDLLMMAKGHKKSHPSLRLVDLNHFNHNMTWDYYCDNTLFHANLVVIRLLGGVERHEYAILKIADWAKKNQKSLAIFHAGQLGDKRAMAYSTIPAGQWQLWDAYLAEGGLDNFRALANQMASKKPQPIKRNGPVVMFQPPDKSPNPRVLIISYRAQIQAGLTTALTAMARQLRHLGLNPIIIGIANAKDTMILDECRAIAQKYQPQCILTNLSFANNLGGGGVFGQCPIYGIYTTNCPPKQYFARPNAITAREIAMNIALPELDGVVHGYMVAFNQTEKYNHQFECYLPAQKLYHKNIEQCAQMVKNTILLQQCPNNGKKLAIIMNNYPVSDGRIANGVGLDTPASLAVILRHLNDNGYHLAEAKLTGHELIEKMQQGITHYQQAGRIIRHSLPIADYNQYWRTLPAGARQHIHKIWGRPENDKFYNPQNKSFSLMLWQNGHCLIGLQPQRGYELNNNNVHDPNLPPPHYYLAFYYYIHKIFGANAIMHLGKHGNLEWLPGKAVYGSHHCFPRITLPPIPHIYPFIINDPGEGTQAKRRANAVILAHLMPPLVRADASDDRLQAVESLIDEYYQSSQLDNRRKPTIQKMLIKALEHHPITQELQLDKYNISEKIAKIDEYLCNIKDMTIRGGLHIYGQAMPRAQWVETMVQLSQYRRGDGQGGNDSFINALAKDMGIENSNKNYQTIYQRAVDIINGDDKNLGQHGRAVYDKIINDIAPRVDDSPKRELQYLLQALNGQYVPAGGSGAPSRGRVDILPSGHNFYSLDGRAIPTPSAWRLGRASAENLVLRIMQDTGDSPDSLFLSCFGTAQMRTGGDDVAQALALLGVEPEWEGASGRLIGAKIVPLSLLNRPRIMVHLRVSGFFRDAFAQTMQIYDSAVKMVMALDESDYDNRPRKLYKLKYNQYIQQGINEERADILASLSIFSAPAGNYGTGIQAVVDANKWQKTQEITDSFLAWGDTAYYGDGLDIKATDSLIDSLKRTNIVVQNQDNREHDILDSDDYYQFSGGLHRAIADLTGQNPINYLNDHSNPDDPKIRSLNEEITRVIYGRATNKKWIQAMMRHGYKGAFEIAASLDYLYGFAVTTNCVTSSQFDSMFQAYILDKEVHDFLQANNPNALRDIKITFQQAQDRGLWHPKHNDFRPLIKYI